jgi:pheromone shutdown-related protein TraB
MMNELSDYLPGVKVTLIDERDRYLAAKIWASALSLTSAEQTQAGDNSAMRQNKKITAVVGAGHLDGLKNHLEKLAGGEENTDVSELEKIPPSGFLSKALRFIIPAVVISLVATGFFRAGTEMGFSMMFQWILWNGSLAALGAILALGHPFAILVSLLGAPFTSLNPFIGVGILSGLVQATFRKPRVSDVHELTDDIASLKGIYRNRISKALLVFFFSSLGSSIGSFVSVPAIAGLLVKLSDH